MTPKRSPEQRTSLRIADEHVTLPPRASLKVAVYCQDADPDTEAIAESDQSLLLERGVSVARGIGRLQQNKYHVLVTNFTEEYQHLNKRSAIAFIEEMHEKSDLISVADVIAVARQRLRQSPFL